MSELPDGAAPRMHDAARLVARWLYRPGFKLRVHGARRVPATGPVVLIANHSTMIEPQLIFGLLPRRSVFLVKRELFRGVVGGFLRLIGQLAVRRGEPDRKPLLDAVRVLRGGGVVAVFPEGTRGDGDVRSAEQGAAWLVRASGAVVLPVACRGTLRPANTRRRFRPPVDLVFGEPFTLDVGRGRTGLIEATERLRTALAELVHDVDVRREESRKLE